MGEPKRAVWWEDFMLEVGPPASSSWSGWTGEEVGLCVGLVMDKIDKVCVSCFRFFFQYFVKRYHWPNRIE